MAAMVQMLLSPKTDPNAAYNWQASGPKHHTPPLKQLNVNMGN